MKTVIFLLLLISGVGFGQVQETGWVWVDGHRISYFADSTKIISNIGIDNSRISPNEQRFTFTNKQGKTLTLILGDTLKIENNMPISEDAKLFVDWVKTYYDTEIKRLNDENNFYKEKYKQRIR